MPTPLALPDPSTVALAQAPLQSVVCQVRHERIGAVADGGLILTIREQLDKYPHIVESAQQGLDLVFGPTGAALGGEGMQRGWRLLSSDRAWTVALLPDFFALECTGYTSWTEFRERMRDLAVAVLAHLEPTMELRIGLRYIDRISLPRIKDPRDWSGYINERFLGPALDRQIGPSLTALQQALHLQGPDGMQVLLRHGTQIEQPSGTWPYVLDTDCFRADSRRLDADGLMQGADSLHTLALQVFQAAITPQLHEMLTAQEEDA